MTRRPCSPNIRQNLAHTQHPRRSRIMSRNPRVLVLIVASAVACYLLAGVYANRAVAASVALPALEAVACPTATQCLAVGGSQDLLVSENDGRSWSIRSLSDGHYLYGIACVSSTRCIAVGDAGTILISGNENQTWSPASSGTTEPLSSVSCPGAGRCYAVGDGGTLLVTDNSGVSWDDMAFDAFCNRWRCLRFTNPVRRRDQ